MNKNDVSVKDMFEFIRSDIKELKEKFDSLPERFVTIDRFMYVESFVKGMYAAVGVIMLGIVVLLVSMVIPGFKV